MRGESSVQRLTEATGLEQSNVSRHLAVLRREGIVARRSKGNQAIYTLHDPSVVQLCEVVCGSLLDRLSDEIEALPDAKVWKGMGI
jgi:ArsR family transcriptional regulator